MEKWEYKILEFSTELYNLGSSTGGSDKDIGITEAVRFREIKQQATQGFFGKKVKKTSSTLTINKIKKFYFKI